MYSISLKVSDDAEKDIIASLFYDTYQYLDKAFTQLNSVSDPDISVMSNILAARVRVKMLDKYIKDMVL
jgi:hypothetical protein